ncbi:hypothetical protein KCP78_18885 [Salmonella enterica subsp. enterica]|nr:hypothetical protein KCP78_18885 [Salmonella enterica subsp. enterica]
MFTLSGSLQLHRQSCSASALAAPAAAGVTHPHATCWRQPVQISYSVLTMRVPVAINLKYWRKLPEVGKYYCLRLFDVNLRTLADCQSGQQTAGMSRGRSGKLPLPQSQRVTRRAVPRKRSRLVRGDSRAARQPACHHGRD